MDSEGDALFWWQGRQTSVTRDHNGLLLEQLTQHSSCLACCTGPAAVKYVPYSEILCCRYLPIRRYCTGLSPCQRKQRHYMELQVVSRHPARPWLWSIKRLELAAEQPDLVKAWVNSTRQRLGALSYRPQRLLVFVNPYGGKRQARRIWSKLAEPILTAAGVSCDLVETQHMGHAEEWVRGLSLDQLQELDGIVAVGGDGLFAELLTAVVQHKHLAAALQLRLGHIPAGSTDAVACTLHGTRDAVTAALHIALGDSTALDVGRMETLPPTTHVQQPTAADMTQQAAAADSQPHAGSDSAAGVGLEHVDVASCATSPAGVWDAGLSVGSHSELLLGRGVLTSSSSGAAAVQDATGSAEVQAGRSVQDSRQQRQQQRRLQKEQLKRSRQQQQAQQQEQQQHVSLHVPLLQHFVCVANYGFLGDVMETSERLRWCGPVRYDIAGVLRFLLLRQYKATVWYKPAPMHASEANGEAAATASEGALGSQGGKQKRRHKQQQRAAASDAVVSPAAVLPLPHHRWPALHARLSIPGLRLPWMQQQQPQQQEDSEQQQQQQSAGGCCEHGVASHLLSDGSQCSSASHSRRSSMDCAPGPLNTVTEGVVVGDALAAAAAAVPSGTLADAVAGAKPHTAAAVPPAKAPGSPFMAATAAAAQAGNPDPISKQQQQKSVSFLPQLTAAVHASAASFSSRGSGSGGGAGGWGLGSLGPSRASSVTSQSSTSRCHSRCNRCSAMALQRSHSRQTFAALAGVAVPASLPAAAPAAAGEQGHAASALAVAAAAAPAASSSSGGGGGSSHHSSSSRSLGGRGAEGADGTVQVMSVPAAAAAAAAAAGSGTNGAPAAGTAAADAAAGPPGPGWVKVEGQYCSVMCVVTSCISDKSRQGLMPEAHLADGRLALVMVEGCSRLQYLRFLIQLASKGIVPGSLPFVKVEYATEVQVEAQGRHSSWNVDGELLQHGRVNVGIHAGLVDVFARGVELM